MRNAIKDIEPSGESPKGISRHRLEIDDRAQARCDRRWST